MTATIVLIFCTKFLTEIFWGEFFSHVLHSKGPVKSRGPWAEHRATEHVANHSQSRKFATRTSPGTYTLGRFAKSRAFESEAVSGKFGAPWLVARENWDPSGGRWTRSRKDLACASSRARALAGSAPLRYRSPPGIACRAIAMLLGLSLPADRTMVRVHCARGTQPPGNFFFSVL